LNNSVLKKLLMEYEKNRINAEHDLEIRKQELYKKNPRLLELENELNNYSINIAKQILNTNKKNYIDTLKLKINTLKKEKESIFNSLKLPKNYLEPRYSCSLCNDTGYISNLNGTSKICSCLQQKLFDLEFNKNIILMENFTNFNFDFYNNTIDEKKYNSTISPRENINIIKNASENFINSFETSNNLLFTGGTGLR